MRWILGKRSKISWTHHTFNTIWGCTKVSKGCDNCYAFVWARRLGYKVWGRKAGRRTFGESHWNDPLLWNRQAQARSERHRVFCSSMADVFDEHPVTKAQLEKLWDLIRKTPFLDWLILTKRPERIAQSLPGDWKDGYPNVWLGTSIESPKYLCRADELRRIPAVVRFLSLEPLLAPIPDLNLEGIDWVVCGGESATAFRPMELDWARQIRDACARAGVAFFFKQSAGRRPETGVELDGRIHHAYPTPRL